MPNYQDYHRIGLNPEIWLAERELRPVVRLCLEEVLQRCGTVRRAFVVGAITGHYYDEKSSLDLLVQVPQEQVETVLAEALLLADRFVESTSHPLRIVPVPSSIAPTVLQQKFGPLYDFNSRLWLGANASTRAELAEPKAFLRRLNWRLFKDRKALEDQGRNFWKLEEAVYTDLPLKEQAEVLAELGYRVRRLDNYLRRALVHEPKEIWKRLESFEQELIRAVESGDPTAPVLAKATALSVKMKELAIQKLRLASVLTTLRALSAKAVEQQELELQMQGLPIEASTRLRRADALSAAHIIVETDRLDGVAWPDLVELLQILGYSIEPKVWYYTLGEYGEIIGLDASQRGRFTTGRSFFCNVWPSGQKPTVVDAVRARYDSPLQANFLAELVTALNIPEHGLIGAVISSAKKFPSSPDNIGSFFCLPIDYTFPHSNGVVRFSNHFWRVGPGSMVTSPSGKTCFVPEGIGGSTDQAVMIGLEQWLEKQRFETAFKHWVKGTEAAKPRLTKERTIEHTGTCSICLGNFKMDRGGRLVLHGYERKGYGWISGRCAGVGYEPYEVSPVACKEYQQRLSARLEQLQQELEKFEQGLAAGTLTSLPDSRGKYDSKYSGKFVPRGDPRWDLELRNYPLDLAARVEGYRSLLSSNQRMLELWKPRPLPGQEGYVMVSSLLLSERSSAKTAADAVERTKLMMTASKRFYGAVVVRGGRAELDRLELGLSAKNPGRVERSSANTLVLHEVSTRSAQAVQRLAMAQGLSTELLEPREITTTAAPAPVQAATALPLEPGKWYWAEAKEDTYPFVQARAQTPTGWEVDLLSASNAVPTYKELSTEELASFGLRPATENDFSDLDLPVPSTQHLVQAAPRFKKNDRVTWVEHAGSELERHYIGLFKGWSKYSDKRRAEVWVVGTEVKRGVNDPITPHRWDTDNTTDQHAHVDPVKSRLELYTGPWLYESDPELRRLPGEGVQAAISSTSASLEEELIYARQLGAAYARGLARQGLRPTDRLWSLLLPQGDMNAFARKFDDHGMGSVHADAWREGFAAEAAKLSRPRRGGQARQKDASLVPNTAALANFDLRSRTRQGAAGDAYGAVHEYWQKKAAGKVKCTPEQYEALNEIVWGHPNGEGKHISDQIYQDMVRQGWVVETPDSTRGWRAYKLTDLGLKVREQEAAKRRKGHTAAGAVRKTWQRKAADGSDPVTQAMTAAAQYLMIQLEKVYGAGKVDGFSGEKEGRVLSRYVVTGEHGQATLMVRFPTRGNPNFDVSTYTSTETMKPAVSDAVSFGLREIATSKALSSWNWKLLLDRLALELEEPGQNAVSYKGATVPANVRLSVRYDECTEWWDSGGAELWESWAAHDPKADSVVLTAEEYQIFLEEASAIAGFDCQPLQLEETTELSDTETEQGLGSSVAVSAEATSRETLAIAEVKKHFGYSRCGGMTAIKDPHDPQAYVVVDPMGEKIWNVAFAASGAAPKITPLPFAIAMKVLHEQGIRLTATAKRGPCATWALSAAAATTHTAAVPDEFWVKDDELCAFYGVNPEDVGLWSDFDVRVYRNASGGWSVEPMDMHAELLDSEWAPRSDQEAQQLYLAYGQGEDSIVSGASHQDDLLIHWKRAIDEAASSNQSNRLIRKLQRFFAESGVYESAASAWDLYRSWKDSFTTFAERLYQLETQYYSEHGSGFHRIRGAGKLIDIVRGVTTDRWSLNDERMMDLLIEPIHSTKFILDEIVKDGLRTKVQQYAKDAGRKSASGIGIVEEQMKVFPAIGRGLTAVEKDIRGDYDENDQFMHAMLAVVSDFKRVKSTIQPLLHAVGEAMAKAEVYSAKLVSDLLE